MSTLSNYQSHDAAEQEAWNQATLVIGALTATAVIAILVFAST